MILSQGEKEYLQLFNDIIVALYADSNVELLLVICRQCITKEAGIFPSMSRHLEMMRKRNNDIQDVQYLRNLVNGVISMLGNENIVLYDNIKELDVQLRKQIKISLATLKSLDNEFVRNKPIGGTCRYVRENPFLKELNARLIPGLKKLYSNVNEIDEDDKDIPATLLKYFLFDMRHKVKYNYINMLIIEDQEQPIIEDKANTLQSFLFYAQRTAGTRYKKTVVNEAVSPNDDAIIETEKETSVGSPLSKDVFNEKNKVTVGLDKEKVLEKLCPSFRNRGHVRKTLEKVDERSEITNGECPKSDTATLCLILKEKYSLFNRNIKSFSDFKEYVHSYYGAVSPSYKKNDCIIGSGTGLSHFDELYNNSGVSWNLCLRKNNQF